MTDQSPEQQQRAQGYPGNQPGGPQGYPGAGQPPAGYGQQQMQPYGYGPVAGQRGPIGQVRGIGVSILLFLITFGIYGWFWYYKTHEEMKQHTGQGLGGGIALVLAIFVGIVMPFITSSEVGDMYQSAGREKPVSGTTGLWSFPGFIIIVGPIVWFVKTNGALNRYWESLGASA